MLKISPSTLKGSLKIPSSKSHSMRALVFGALAKGKTRIHHFLASPDTIAMCEALRSLGITIDMQGTSIEVVGGGGSFMPSQNVIDAGNSGQVLRFVGALAALQNTYTVLTGDHSIRENRPIQPLLDGLSQLGAFAVSSRLNGKAPLIIKGPLQRGEATLSGEDSQPVSALLMALACVEGMSTLHVKNGGETPWIELTLQWLKERGVSVSHTSYAEYRVKGEKSLTNFEKVIGGDFSSAAFPLAAALVTSSNLVLENLDWNDVQGDKKLVDFLSAAGARLEKQERSLRCCGKEKLRGFTLDANEIIDAVPILAVLGCFAEGKTEIVNVAIARKKESDRLSAITQELRKMGALIEEKQESLEVWPSELKGAPLDSHHDHRIAMALVVAALGARGDSTLQGEGCIAKSYPCFVSDFQSIGAKIWET